MRAIFEVMGVTDVVAKSTGSSNPTTWFAPRWTVWLNEHSC
jgi:ribosomal protein S5